METVDGVKAYYILIYLLPQCVYACACVHAPVLLTVNTLVTMVVRLR